jgi:ribosomal protein L37AE/L43A
MTRQLKPCGTNAAWERHCYHSEPVDDACEQAHRAYNRDRARDIRARQTDAPPCTSCGKPRKAHQGARGWCQACYCRWAKAGRPTDGPPPVRARNAGRREDYRWLRDIGEPIATAAQRVGITRETAQKWEAAA